MIVLVVSLAVVGVSLLALAILGFGLFTQFRRLQRAAQQAQSQIQPAVEALRPQTPQGRHRAP